MRNGGPQCAATAVTCCLRTTVGGQGSGRALGGEAGRGSAVSSPCEHGGVHSRTQMVGKLLELCVLYCTAGSAAGVFTLASPHTCE